MNRGLLITMMTLFGCGASAAKPPPAPAEEAFVLDSKEAPASTAAGATTAGASGRQTSSATASGTAPDLSGIVVGTRADRSPPLQGLSPGLTNGNLTSYTPDAPKPFMGFSLIDRNFVSVDSGKITDVTNGIDPANCPKLLQKLNAAYGPAKKSAINVWSVGPAEISVMGANSKTSCTIMIRVAK